MTTERYARHLSAMLAHYGLTSNPLSEGDMATLNSEGVSIDDAYSIACDVAAGFTIAESRRAMASAA